MSCAQKPLSSICPVHYRDHSRFLILMHHMDIETHFPSSIMEMDDDIPMYKANHSMEASQIPAWMSEGYQTQHKAKQKGWPIPMWQYEPPPEIHPNCTPSHSTNTSHHTHTTGAPLYDRWVDRWVMVPRWTLWRVKSYRMHPHISIHTVPSSDPHLSGPIIHSRIICVRKSSSHSPFLPYGPSHQQWGSRVSFVGDGLVPQIANQRNANQCQRHVMWWEYHDYVCYVWHGKNKFFLHDQLCRANPAEFASILAVYFLS